MTDQRSFSDADIKRRKLQLIEKGKEVAVLIVGSHQALDNFQAIYSEWAECRKKSIAVLEQLADVINKSCKESDTIADVIGGIDRLGDNIPDPTVSWGAKMAAAIGTFVAGLFAKKMSEKEIGDKEFEIKQTFQKDISLSSDVYKHGVMCSSQFGETRKCIRTFHGLITEEKELESIIHDENALEFFNEIAFYNPHNTSVFYRRLKFCYERLLSNSESAESRPFIRVFEEIPSTVQVINLLAWSFDTDGFEVSILDNAWKELLELFLNPEEFNIKSFLQKIRHCIFFLNKESYILERSKKSLFGLNEQSRTDQDKYEPLAEQLEIN